MMRLVIALCLFATWLFADLKILSTKQLDNGVTLVFNKNIQQSAFKGFVLDGKDTVRYVYDVKAQLLGPAKKFDFHNASIRVAQNSKERVRLVIALPKKTKIDLTIHGKQASFKTAALKKEDASVAALFAQREKQVESNNAVANTGKGRVIVIDPGHGGKDCGAIGVERVCEKVIALKISKFLETELKKRGYKVHMTRQRDVFIGLRERTAFANNKNADLFLSIHANAISENREKTQGVESYFLSTARSERAKKVAALENKDDTEVMNYFSKQSFLNTLNTQRIVASNKLAIDIQYGMLQSLRAKYQQVVDGGVREGPFWVLVGALMPSVLLEVGYITHPKEGRRINQDAYQRLLAQGIANGVDGYFQKNP